MVQIRTKITIAAPVSLVYSTLTDLPKWNEWNPFIQHVAGEPKEGERITLRLNKQITISPMVVKVKENEEFRWKGKVACGGIFDGEHYFLFEEEEVEGKKVTTMTHGENFSGILPPLLGGVMRDTETNFVKLNDELKKRCEAA